MSGYEAMATEYVCEVTGKKYKTARGAKDSAKRERLLDWQRNYFRLNATSVEHLVELMAEKGKEFWGWDLEVSELRHRGCFETSIGKPFVRFSLSLKLVPGKRYNKHTRIGEYILSHICGLDALFNWTSFRDQSISGRYSVMTFSFNLERFPLIKEKYVSYSRSVSDYNEWEKEKSVVELEAVRFSKRQEDYEMADHRVAILEHQLDIARNTRNEIAKYYVNGYNKLWRNQAPEPQIDEKLDRMFKPGVS
jgi:hypothetical protein